MDASYQQLSLARVARWWPLALVSLVSLGMLPAATSSAPLPAPQRGPTPVHVLVSKSQEGDRVVYRYRVLNGSSEISALAIGWDDSWQRAELRVDFDSLVCESPWDWTCESKWSKDEERGYVIWTSLNGYNPIPPNDEIACFSLSVPAEDPALERCHWTTNVDLEAAPKYSGTLIADTERSPVQVLVTKKERPNGVEYRYRVVNGSTYPITSLWVGVDEHCASSGEILISDEFPPTGIAPGGWTFDPIPTEEDSMGSIRWEIDNQSDELPGGRELNGLSVTLPAEDPIYETGHWRGLRRDPRARRRYELSTLEPVRLRCAV
jgi:hypothetical protein